LVVAHEVVDENLHDISVSHIPSNDVEAEAEAEAEAEVVVLVHHVGARVGVLVLLVVSDGDTDTHRSHFVNTSSSREGIRKESNEEERAHMAIVVE
jgi:hypothetical protein